MHEALFSTRGDELRLVGIDLMARDASFDPLYFEMVTSGLLDPRVEEHILAEHDGDTGEQELPAETYVNRDLAANILGCSPPYVSKLGQEGTLTTDDNGEFSVSALKGYIEDRIIATEALKKQL